MISYGAALLVCMGVFVRQRGALRDNLPALIMLGLSAGWCNVAFIMAVLDGAVVRVLLLFYLSPFWAVCLGWLMLDERMDGKTLLVFLVAVGGAIIMLWDESIGLPWPRDASDWLAVSSGFAFALSNVFVRRMQAVGVWLKSAMTWLGVVVVAGVWIASSQYGGSRCRCRRLPVRRPAGLGRIPGHDIERSVRRGAHAGAPLCGHPAVRTGRRRRFLPAVDGRNRSAPGMAGRRHDRCCGLAGGAPACR